MRQMQCA